MPVVQCPTCHREERWTIEAGGEVRVEVVVAGGGRQPAVDPQWARGRTALAAQAGETGPVAGVCEGCGQLLVAETGEPLEGLPTQRVRIDTPQGRLVVAETVQGPDGPMDRAAAEAWLEAQYKVPITRGLLGDLGRSVFFLGLLGPFLLWLFSMLMMGTFFAAIVEGAPEATRGSPGFDANPAPPPRAPAD